LERFCFKYLREELLSKYDDGKPSPEKEATTWLRFHEAERMCTETNQRLTQPSGIDIRNEPAILLARNIVERVLGEFSWDECEPSFGWGPGASTRLRRRESDAAFKYSGNPETTAGNAILAHTAISRVALWKQSLGLTEQSLDGLTVVDGNRIVTVPKNQRTDRVIAIEPDMNMYIQKGIGGVIRKRLRRWGVNLDDQRPNQQAAQYGSETGLLATIDLSMASDTISREVVSLLIPPEWLLACELCRSPIGTLPSGERVVYRKFSSMGNGYTFELESLIFFSIVRAVVTLMGGKGHHICVYGDDITCPSECYEEVVRVLSLVGFKTNEKKSFATTPFRESCGKHYFAGYDVTPFYIRKPVVSLDRLFLLHNNMWRWREQIRAFACDSVLERLSALLSELKRLAPATWREPRLPDGYGDGAFIGHLHDLTLCPHPLGWEYWIVRCLQRGLASLECDIPGLSLKSLSRLETEYREREIRSVLDRIMANRGITPRKKDRYVSSASANDVLPSEAGGYRECELLIPRYSSP
jgi:hypothetical protein